MTKVATTVTRDDGVVAVEGEALCYTMPIRLNTQSDETAN
jgi:hypothetical protein